MTAFRIALLATAVAIPVFAVAQQMDHSTMPMQDVETESESEEERPADAPTDPDASDDMDAMEEESDAPADQGMEDMPGHDMDAMEEESGPAGQGMDAMPGHDMDAMQGQGMEAMPGHDMDAMQGQGMEDMPGHDMDAMDTGPERPDAPPPPSALSGPEHAADLIYGPSDMAEAREELRVEQGDLRAYMVMADQLELRFGDGADGYLWDAQGWYGGDYNKIWIKTEGEGGFGEGLESGEVQVLWSRAILPFFDFQAGVRYDFAPDQERAHLVVGIQGLAPYFFEIDAAAFLSDEGDLTARFEAEYDQLITQKLILQPRLEFELAAQDIPDLRIGAGLSSFEAGLRLRYEFVPEFAPYIGVGYERSLGGTADFARAAGEDVGGWNVTTGLRVWF